MIHTVAHSQRASAAGGEPTCRVWSDRDKRTASTARLTDWLTPELTPRRHEQTETKTLAV